MTPMSTGSSPAWRTQAATSPGCLSRPATSAASGWNSSRKRLPHGARVAVLWDATGPLHQRQHAGGHRPSLGVYPHVLEVRSHDEFDDAFATAQAVQADGLVILASPLFTVHPPRLGIWQRGVGSQLFTITEGSRGNSGLMSYGPEESDASWGGGVQRSS